MQAKLTILMLLMMTVALVGCTGILGSVAVGARDASISGPATQLSSGYRTTAFDEKAYLCHLSVENVIGLLYVKATGPAFGAPGISRARSQVHQNENRKQIIQFVAENPGSRLYDIIKALDMNIGTVRYHLMILSLNHVLTPYQDGASVIRYFTNTGSYTGDQMKVIALLRREPTSRLLGALAGQPSMPGSKISEASGLPYSDVNRYLRELISKGVVLKEPLGREKYQYRIAPDHEEHVAEMARQLKGQAEEHF